jgi:ceramide glucosyltransferase
VPLPEAPIAVAGPPVSIVQPHRGIETYSAETLTSIFNLNYPRYEILFCVADCADPVVPLIRKHIAAHPERPARLLFGDDAISGNPKLNNIVKGWDAAKHEWIILADSNVLMPRDYVTRLLARWRRNTGLVCSPPIGARAEGFAAHLECAFLNTYQARWQYASEALGYGFAQGKTMLWRKEILEAQGGIRALAAEIAEDAAATKAVRLAGLSIHLVDGPFPQPLGRRTFSDFWKRQVRWSRLRRATFTVHFLPEILTTSFLCIGAAALAAPLADLRPASAALVAATLWYSAEAALAQAAGWPLARWSLPAWIARDLLLPLVWIGGLSSDKFEWRGEKLAVDGTYAPVRADLNA